jgi:hypothetical protein
MSDWLTRTKESFSPEEREAAIYADGREQARADRRNIVNSTGTWYRNAIPQLPDNRVERETWLRGYAAELLCGEQL